MNNWKETTLGEIAEITDCPHSTPKWTSTGYFVVRNFNLPNGRIVKEKPSYTDKENYLKRIRRAKPRKGDIVLSREAPIGSVGLVSDSEDICLGQRVVLVRPTGCDSTFLLYEMLSPIIQNEFRIAEATGSVVSNFRIPQIQSLKIFLPSLSEQKAIAAVLSSFDDKIELLRRQNKTLEKIAQTIFKEWFVNFTVNGKKLKIDNSTDLPERWRMGTLGEIVTHVKENVVPSQKKNCVFLHYSIPAFDSGKKPVIEHGEGILSNKYSVKSYSFLVSKLNPSIPRIWTIFDAEGNSICSTEFQVLKLNDPSYFAFVHCFLNSEYFTREFASKAQGTSGSHQRAKPEDILNMDLAIPNTQENERFQTIAFPLLAKMDSNHCQIQTLSKLRDLLLPKLMKGEIKVKI